MSTTILIALIGGVSMIVTAVISFFGGKNSAAAALKNAWTEQAEMILDQLRKDNEHCNAKLARQDLKIHQRDGEITNLQQQLISLMDILRRSGLDIPKYRAKEIIYMPNEEQHVRKGDD
jgi:hypothetical protein